MFRKVLTRSFTVRVVGEAKQQLLRTSLVSFQLQTPLHHLSTTTTAPTVSPPTHSLADEANFGNAKRYRLDIAIVGAPNSGKSQLLNVLTASNVAAVSRKRHTTRDGVMGIRTISNSQLVFVDTPGFLKDVGSKREKMMTKLMNSVTTEMQSVDFTLLVVDAARHLNDPDVRMSLKLLMRRAMYARGRDEADPDNEAWRAEMPESPERFALVLNKVDLVKPKTKLLTTADILYGMAEECIEEVIAKWNSNSEKDYPKTDWTVEELFPPVHYVSALHEDGTQHLLEDLVSRATESRIWPVEPGTVTDAGPVDRVTEIIREKIYRHLHREVPHHVTQVNRLFKVLDAPGRAKKVYLIEQELVVRTKSHRRLVQGRSGATLSRIQQTAERDISAAFDGATVKLSLFVKHTTAQHIRSVDTGDMMSLMDE